MLRLVLALGLWTLAVSAGAQADADPAPPRCALCKMAVTDQDHAARLVTLDSALVFDDVGCLIQFERRGLAAADTVRNRFVRALGSDQWIAVERAFWVFAQDLRTPMGYGWHAFSDRDRAGAFLEARPQAKLSSWAEVQKLLPASPGKM